MSVLNGPSEADMEVWCEATIDSAAESSVRTAASHLLVVYRARGEEIDRLRAEVDSALAKLRAAAIAGPKESLAEAIDYTVKWYVKLIDEQIELEEISGYTAAMEATTGQRVTFPRFLSLLRQDGALIDWLSAEVWERGGSVTVSRATSPVAWSQVVIGRTGAVIVRDGGVRTVLREAANGAER